MVGATEGLGLTFEGQGGDSVQYLPDSATLFFGEFLGT